MKPGHDSVYVPPPLSAPNCRTGLELLLIPSMCRACARSTGCGFHGSFLPFTGFVPSVVGRQSSLGTGGWVAGSLQVNPNGGMGGAW